MSPGRLALVHALIAAIVGGAAWDVVHDEEHWPYSQYPMFSTVERDWSHRTLRLFAVGAGGRESPVLDAAVLQPFDQCRLSTSLTRLRRDHGALRTALADSYERIAGRDVAAPIEALRLYQLQWRLTRGEADDARPDERVLLAEYRPVDLAR
jgi:hypothetical protein